MAQGETGGGRHSGGRSGKKGGGNGRGGGQDKRRSGNGQDKDEDGPGRPGGGPIRAGRGGRGEDWTGTVDKTEREERKTQYIYIYITYLVRRGPEAQAS